MIIRARELAPAIRADSFTAIICMDAGRSYRKSRPFPAKTKGHGLLARTLPHDPAFSSDYVVPTGINRGEVSPTWIASKICAIDVYVALVAVIAGHPVELSE